MGIIWATQGRYMIDLWPTYGRFTVELCPKSGTVVLPTWWRVIYVPVMPIMFDGTLMYNLSYGYLAQKNQLLIQHLL